MMTCKYVMELYPYMNTRITIEGSLKLSSLGVYLGLITIFGHKTRLSNACTNLNKVD